MAEDKVGHFVEQIQFPYIVFGKDMTQKIQFSAADLFFADIVFDRVKSRGGVSEGTKPIRAK